MSRASSGSEWSGEMLDRPEMVAAFAAQLRRVMSDQAASVHRIRREAEAMWKANPPEGYGSFEAWWRHGRVTAPFAKIQDHLEEAARLTFALEARYRRNRHEIPDRRQAAAQAREEAAALPRGENAAVSPPPHQQGRAASRAEPERDMSFMDIVQRGNGRRTA